MQRLTLALGTERDRTAPGAHTARLINLYSEGVAANGSTDAVLRPAFGMVAFAALEGVFLRAMAAYDGDIYALMSGGLWRVQSGGASLLASTATGQTGGLSWNLGSVAGFIGGEYFVWDGAALTTPATGAVAGQVGWVEYLAGRTLVGEADTGKFSWSDIGDPETFNGLNFATAEAREDSTVRGVVTGDVLYLMGARTTELWAPAGAGANAFARAGVVIDRGLKSYGLVCIAAGALFFVGDDDVCYLLTGNQLLPVSPPWVVNALRTGQPETAFYWEERGHKFCCIAFRDRPAVVYDMTTKAWWERAEGVAKAPWRARVAARMAGEWLIGSHDGRINALRDERADLGGVLYREATSASLSPGRWFSVPEVQLRVGGGYDAGRIGLQIGDGEAFGPLMIRDLPTVGQIGQPVTFRALGRWKHACLRVVQTDDADAPLMGSAMVAIS